MGIFTTNEPLKTVEQPEVEVVKEAPEVVAPDPDFVDRSLYNCDACGGDGLVRFQDSKVDVICPQCQGKGKLN